MDPIIDRLTADGRRIQVEIAKFLGNYIAVISFDGKVHTRGVPEDKPRVINGEERYVIGGAVAVTKAEGEAIRAALAAADAADPEVQAHNLRSRRDDILDEIRGWDDEASAVVSRAMDDESGNPAWGFRKADEYQAKATEARKRLADFDAEHPEVKAAIEAEKAEAAERFARWN